jgi:hypothetical protein
MFAQPTVGQSTHVVNRAEWKTLRRTLEFGARLHDARHTGGHGASAPGSPRSCTEPRSETQRPRLPPPWAVVTVQNGCPRQDSNLRPAA